MKHKGNGEIQFNPGHGEDIYVRQSNLLEFDFTRIKIDKVHVNISLMTTIFSFYQCLFHL